MFFTPKIFTFSSTGMYPVISAAKIKDLVMKFLKWYGENKFWWAAILDIEKVPILFEFYCPVQTDSVDLFKFSCKDRTADLYRTFIEVLYGYISKWTNGS